MRSLAARFSPALAAFTFGASALSAQQIDTGQHPTAALGQFGSPGGGAVGSPGGATFGQTFTRPFSYDVLDQFTFWLHDSEGPQFEFTAYIARWNGTRAFGPMLYASALQTSPAEGAGFTAYTFSTGGLPLPGGTYVAFLNASPYSAAHPFPASPVAFAWMRFGINAYDDSYAGGAFVYDTNGSDFSALTTRPWRYNGVQVYDVAFTASFSASPPPEPTPVPEPATIALVATGALVVGVVTRRRRA
jgi:hypothetical protein